MKEWYPRGIHDEQMYIHLTICIKTDFHFPIHYIHPDLVDLFINFIYFQTDVVYVLYAVIVVLTVLLAEWLAAEWMAGPTD